MKHLLAILFLVGVVNIGDAQIYKINNYNGKTVNTCKGQFTSSQFIDANINGYGNSQNYTVTFCSASGTKLKINFYYVELEAGFDKLYIYDGPSTSSPLIATLTGNQKYKDYTSSGTCLTFRFISNSFNAIGRGWLGFLGCPPTPCGTNPVASDECATATSICDLNGYCGTTSGWYTADHVNIDMDNSAIFCGTIQNNSWLSFIASASTASFNITSSNCSDPSLGIQAMIVSTNCTSFSSKACVTSGTNTFPITASGLVVGQKYYIMVDGEFGNDCDYTIQATSGIQTVSVTSVGAVNNICAGQSLTLKATVTGAVGTPTYTWSPAPVSGQGTNTATYAASVTTYSCTVSGACGGVVATYIPTINPVPTVSVAITGSSTICTGGTGKTLSAAGTLVNPTLTFNNNNTSSIPYGATGVTSNIVVSGISGTVGSQLTSVCVDISHGYDEDLDISLKCPNGTIIDLSSDNGGSGNNYTNTCFSTSGPSITTGTPPFTGTYTPEQSLSLLSGCTANGTWSLIVKDDAAPDAGTLRGWSLTFQNDVTYSWSPSTGLSSTTSAVVTANPSSTTTYTVTATDKVGCSGIATSTITVVTTPAAPTVTSPVKYCTGETASDLTATGTNLLWYTASSGGTGSSTPPPVSTAAAGNTNYYVSQTTGTCEGPRALIAVQIFATPASISVTTPVIYCQKASSVQLSATGTNVLWYTVPTGGVGSSTAPKPSTATVGTTKHYVTQTVGICESARAIIDVIVNITPAAPTVSNITYCKDATPVLKLTATGNNLLWYTVATGGTGNTTAPTPSTTTVGTKNYYVSQTTGVCEGPRAKITVKINPKSNASFTYANATFCITGPNPSPTITGVAGGTFTAPAGLIINASTGLITLSTSTLGTYKVTYQVGGTCPNNATFDVTITNSPNANFTYASANYCQYGANPQPIFVSGASGGTFSVTPAGLVFVNGSAGVIDLTASTPGIKYTIINTIPAGGGCATSTSSPFEVTINPSPTITSSTEDSVCSGVRLNIALSSVVPASYSWVADPSSFVIGESIISVNGGVITDSLVNTTDVPQEVVYNVSALTGASCVNLPAHTITVTVNPAPYLTTIKNTTVCTGEPLLISLNSNLSSNYSWSAIDNANVLGESIIVQTSDSIKDVLMHTSAVLEKVTYIVKSKSLAGKCYNTTPDSIVVTVNPAYTLKDGLSSNVCSGTPLSIALSSTGNATYSWVAIADNVNVIGESLTLQTNNTINNTLINTSNNNQLVNYAVTVTSLDNCLSPSKAIGVTVYPAPSLTNSNIATVCSGTPLNIVLAGNVKSSFTWSASDNTNTNGETTSIQSTGVINDTIFNKTNSPQEITYTINLVSDTGSCLSEAQTIKVTVNPEPILLNANTEEVCSGVPLDIVLFPTLNALCSWKAIDNANTTGESLTDQANSIINDSITNTLTTPQKVIYKIKLTSAANCINTSDEVIEVTVNPRPKMNNNSTAVICSGVPLNIVLSSNIPAAYTWLAVDNISVTGETLIPNNRTIIKDTLINVTTATQIVNYSLTLTAAASNCINSDEVIAVTVNPEPILTNAKTVTICSGEPLNIALTSNAPATYSWIAADNLNTTGESYVSNKNTAIINDVILNTSIIPQVVMYTVSVQLGSCRNSIPQQVAVTVNPTPVADTASLAINSSACGTKSGAITGIAMVSGMVPLKYIWKNSAGVIVDTTLNLNNVGPGAYILTITDANGCSIKVGAGKTLIVKDENKVIAAFTPNPASGEMPLLVTFTNNSIGANNYSWNFDDGTSILKDPTYLYDKIGKFNACLIANDGGNCNDTACVIIDVYINSVFIIPNVFTPNNDGVNDLFTISGKGIESLHAEIYNRWGQKEYEWNTTNGGWDGRSATGLPAVSGTYYYIIKATGMDGKKYLEKGSLMLIN